MADRSSCSDRFDIVAVAVFLAVVVAAAALAAVVVVGITAAVFVAVAGVWAVAGTIVLAVLGSCIDLVAVIDIVVDSRSFDFAAAVAIVEHFESF